MRSINGAPAWFFEIFEELFFYSVQGLYGFTIK